MVKLTSKSILAGLLIAFAGALYLQCNNKLVGAILFSLGLIGVILLEAYLFTGKIGYLTSKEVFKDFKVAAHNLIVMLVLNLLTAFLVGLLYRICIGATTVVELKLAKEWYRILWDSTLCGICVYLAVELYKRTKNVFTIVLPIAGFILTSGEHCIAYAFYVGTGTVTPTALGYLGLMIIGNSAGALLINSLNSSH